MMVKIKCPSCSTDGYMSLLESSYEMPYRCWKCKEFFTLKVEDNEVASMVKLSEEEYQRVKEVEDMRSKFKRQI